MSGDGRSIAFQSSATNLVSDDTDHIDDVSDRAAIVPKINKITPTSIARGTTVTLTIKGSYFLPDARVSVIGDGLTLNNFFVISDSQIQASITATANATIGTGNIGVALPGTGGGQNFGAADLCTCLSVTS